MISIIKTNQPEVGHGIAIFDPTIVNVNEFHFLHRSLCENTFTCLPNSYLPLQEDLLMKAMFMYELFTIATSEVHWYYETST